MEELANIYNIYLPLSSRWRIVIVQFLALNIKHRVFNFFSYLLLAASAVAFICQFFVESSLYYIAVGLLLGYGAIDYYCYRVAFHDYFKSYKKIFFMFNVKPDLIRYLKFKERLIAHGMYEKDMVSRAIKNLEVELLDVSPPSIMKDGMIVFLLSCFVSIAASFLDALSVIDRKLLLLIVLYFILKAWLMKSSLLSGYRKKVELKQFLMRLESELVLSDQQSCLVKEESQVTLLQQASF